MLPTARAVASCTDCRVAELSGWKAGVAGPLTHTGRECTGGNHWLAAAILLVCSSEDDGKASGMQRLSA